MQFVNELRAYGLSEKESTVYLSLLSLGPATANTVAERADLVRTTTYDILKTLKEKGIVGCITKNKILYYEAAPPEKLIDIIDEKRRTLSAIIPSLQQLSLPAKSEPRFEVFEGKEGIKTVYQDILSNALQIEAFSNTKQVADLLPHFIPHFTRQLVERKIPLQLLSEETSEAIELKKKDKNELRSTRFLPELKDIPITEYIYGENVVIINANPEEPIGIIIRNKDFAQAQSQLFAGLWSKSEEDKNERKKNEKENARKKKNGGDV